MEETQYIPIENICALYSIPLTFISELEEINLVELEIVDGIKYVKITHIQSLEKLIRLHFELNINLEGLDVVNNLLDQITQLQDENLFLRNRLKRFE